MCLSVWVETPAHFRQGLGLRISQSSILLGSFSPVLKRITPPCHHVASQTGSRKTSELLLGVDRCGIRGGIEGLGPWNRTLPGRANWPEVSQSPRCGGFGAWLDCPCKGLNEFQSSTWNQTIPKRSQTLPIALGAKPISALQPVRFPRTLGRLDRRDLLELGKSSSLTNPCMEYTLTLKHIPDTPCIHICLYIDPPNHPNMECLGI